MKKIPELQTLMTGLALGESPRWHDDRLQFSDWGAHEVIAVDLAGKSEVIAHMPSLPFCIDWLPDGHFHMLVDPVAVAAALVELMKQMNEKL